MTQLAISNLDVSFDDLRALKNVALRVEPGEFFCIVGPTNAGKSTLLKTIAGLVRPDNGSIGLAGVDHTKSQPRDRNVSLLFQNIALFPNLTGFENIAFPLRTARIDETGVRDRVEALADILKVKHVLHRLPRTFSGGEQQRVAIGRSIARPADLLMLDEPLTNLDARIRIALRIEFKELHRRLGQTVLYVTHDQVEAMSMSDRIAVLHEGRIQQIATPDEIYNRPANRFVAEFIGQPAMNILPAELVAEDGATGTAVDIGGCRFSFSQRLGEAHFTGLPRQLMVGVRPEKVRIGPASTTETPHRAEILWIEHLGSKSIVDLRLNGTMLRAKAAPDSPVHRARSAWFGFDLEPHHILDPKTGRFFNLSDSP